MPDTGLLLFLNDVKHMIASPAKMPDSNCLSEIEGFEVQPLEDAARLVPDCRPSTLAGVAIDGAAVSARNSQRLKNKVVRSCADLAGVPAA